MAVIEQRLQIGPDRFRVPDVCVIPAGAKPESIFRTPPFICIEVLSPEDRLPRVLKRLEDYFDFGVPYVFLLDPELKKAWRCTREGLHEVSELRTENPDTLVPVADLFDE